MFISMDTIKVHISIISLDVHVACFEYPIYVYYLYNVYPINFILHVN
jgi:hypothetical protein